MSRNQQKKKRYQHPKKNQRQKRRKKVKPQKRNLKERRKKKRRHTYKVEGEKRRGYVQFASAVTGYLWASTRTGTLGICGFRTKR
jgi:hypothetical protein